MGRASDTVRIYTALALMGFVTANAQIVFLRKGIVNYSGNELGLAVGLFAWLGWVGAGGLLSRRFFSGIRRPDRALYLVLLFLLVLFPVSVIAIELVRPAAQVPVGQVVGLGFMAAAYGLLLAPFCLVDGADFTLGAAAAGPGKAAAAFAAESLGAAAGGVFFFLVGTGPLTAQALSLLLAAAGALVLVWAGWSHRMVVAASLLVFLASGLFFWPLGVALERSVAAARWRGYEVQWAGESHLGSLVWAVRARPSPAGEQQVLFYDGSPLVNHPDIRAAEEAVWPALIVHPDPQAMLLVASRATGVLEQALRSPAARIDLVMLDRQVLELERERIPATSRALARERVRILVDDGRSVIRRAPSGTWDVIILDLPDPSTLQFNRYYTAGFFRQAARALAPGGVIMVSVAEPANTVTPVQARFLASLDRAAAVAFPHRTWYPLGRYVLLAGEEEVARLTGQLADDVHTRWRTGARFVTSATLDSDLSADRMEAVVRALDAASGTRVNDDLRPEAVRHRLRLWSGRTGYAGILSLPESSRAWTAFVVALAVMVLGATALGAAAGGGVPGALILLLGGISGIGVEAVLLYLYQVDYGYLYSRLALLLALYMSGMAAGAWFCSGRRMRVTVPAWAWSAYLLLLFAFVSNRVFIRLPEIAGLAVYLVLMAMAGWLTGLAFAVGSAVLEGARWRHPGGAAYGLDLLGAAAGILICGLILPLGAGLLAPVRFLLLLATGIAAGLAARKK